MSRILDYVLTPEEAEKLRLVDGTSLARLRELASAEREGRGIESKNNSKEDETNE